MKIYQHTDSELGAFANQVKDVLADRMNLPILDDVVVVIAEPSWFGKLSALWKGLDANKPVIAVCRYVEKTP